jgi:hypothetical protein
VLRRAATALVAVAVAVPLIATRADAYIYWSMSFGTSGGRIGQAANTGSVLNFTLINPIGGLSGATAIAIDGSHIYWGNGPNQIGRADLDGNNANPNFVSGIFTANALAVDSVNGFLFWADESGSRIGRANLADGKGVNTAFISSTVSKATGVAVDSTAKVVYWTVNLGAGGGIVGRANEDGSGVQSTWKTGLFGAQGLTLDATSLYWVNGPDQIGRMNLDGTGVNGTYIVGPRIGTKGGSAAETPVPLVVNGGYLYWGNLFDGYLGRVPNVSGSTSVTNKFVGILGDASGLAINNLASPGPLPPPGAPDIDLFRSDVERVDLARGIERSLLAKLDAVEQALDDGDQAAACDGLAAFVSQTDALTGKKIPLAPAVGLIADAQVMRETLGCAAE